MQHAVYRDSYSKEGPEGAPFHDERHRDDWVFSYWILRYWALRHNLTVSTKFRGHAHLIAPPPQGKVVKPYAHVGCGAPNCGRYPQCIDEWDLLHHGRIVMPESLAHLEFKYYRKSQNVEG